MMASRTPSLARLPDAMTEELLHALRDNGRLLADLASRYAVARLSPPSGERPIIRCPADVAAYLAPEMADLAQEQLRAVLLDVKNRVLGVELVYQGGLNSVSVRLADCFREAVRAGAAAVILVHNHPSSDTTPSPEDVRLTREADQAGQLLGVEVLDHVILGRAGFASLRERGLYRTQPAGVAQGS